MKTYQCHKRVKAIQITAVTISGVLAPNGSEREEVRYTATYADGSGETLDPKMTARYAPKAGDYLVEYEDGYRSISPKDAFEGGYAEIDATRPLSSTMSFGKALEALKEGRRVARVGWNGKGMFLFLVPGSRFQVNRPPLLGIYPEGTTIDYHAHIDMKTAQGYVVPWLASQADLLSDDWCVVEPA